MGGAPGLQVGSVAALARLRSLPASLAAHLWRKAMSRATHMVATPASQSYNHIKPQGGPAQTYPNVHTVGHAALGRCAARGISQAPMKA